MYSQLLVAGELPTNDYKPLGTLMTLDLDSRIDEMNLIERDPLKGEH
jgi:hypothetical protein